MRNYDLSPLFRQWIGFDKLANAMKGTADAGFLRTILRKATTTTIALLWLWPGLNRTIWRLRPRVSA